MKFEDLSINKIGSTYTIGFDTPVINSRTVNDNLQLYKSKRIKAKEVIGPDINKPENVDDDDLYTYASGAHSDCSLVYDYGEVTRVEIS